MKLAVFTIVCLFASHKVQAQSLTGPRISGIVNASFSPGPLAPGALFTIFGERLSNSTVSASRLPLPLILGGTRVLVNNREVPLVYVSPTQINCQVPYETEIGAVFVDVWVSGNPQYASSQADVVAGRVGLFSDSNRRLIAVAGSDLVGPNRPAKPGEIVVLYGTGSGVHRPALSTGAGAPANPLALPVSPITVTVNGVGARVLFAGSTPSFVGLTQINLELPSSLPDGDASIEVFSGRTAGSKATIPVKNAGSSGPPGALPSIVSFDNVPSGTGMWTLRWETSQADSVSISNVGTVIASGIRTVSPQQTTTYRLTAQNSAGQTSAETTVTVNNVNLPPSILEFSATPSNNIAPGTTVVLRWNTANASLVTVDGQIQTTSGTVEKRPFASTTYRLRARTSAGEVFRDVSVSVAVPSSNACRISRWPIQVYTSSAGIFGSTETGSSFTTTENTAGVVNYVSSYRGQAGIIASSSAAAFVAGASVPTYGLYNGTTGGGLSVTLPPGTWRAAFRDVSGQGDNNAQAIKFTSRATFTGCIFPRSPAAFTRNVAPGQSFAQPFTVFEGEQMYMFGVNNHQFNIWVIPADQIDNALNGRAFSFMKDYSCSYPCGGYPSYQRVDLPPGNYAVLYKHVSTSPGEFTIYMEWVK